MMMRADAARRAPRPLIGLVVSLVVVTVVQAAGGILTYPSVTTWYQSLAKPSFTPPDAVFMPVWTALYIAMAIAAWLVWLRGDDDPVVRPALAAYFIQLGLNVGWSLFFFALQAPMAGLVVVVALAGAIAITTGFFFRVSVVAGGLMVPYLGWVTFGAILNAAIVVMN